MAKICHKNFERQTVKTLTVSVVPKNVLILLACKISAPTRVNKMNFSGHNARITSSSQALSALS